jgi:hypothetical protein
MGSTILRESMLSSPHIPNRETLDAPCKTKKGEGREYIWSSQVDDKVKDDASGHQAIRYHLHLIVGASWTDNIFATFFTYATPTLVVSLQYHLKQSPRNTAWGRRAVGT